MSLYYSGKCPCIIHLKSSKLLGLQKIDAYNLPHPSWKFVQNAEELGDFINQKVKYGWTIRTCLPGKDLELKLPFANKVPPSNVKTIITKFNTQLGKGAIFVVYPSWEEKKTGNCLLTDSQLIIESISGSISYLTDGVRNPEQILIFDRYTLRVQTINGKTDFLEQEEISKLKYHCKKIIETNVVLEWVITEENDFFFFHWIEFKKN